VYCPVLWEGVVVTENDGAEIHNVVITSKREKILFTHKKNPIAKKQKNPKSFLYLYMFFEIINLQSKKNKKTVS